MLPYNAGYLSLFHFWTNNLENVRSLLEEDGECMKPMLRLKWCYLYKAVGKQGNTIDFLLIKRRKRMSAQSFLIKAIKNNGKSELINIDKSGSNKHAIRIYNKRSLSTI